MFFSSDFLKASSIHLLLALWICVLWNPCWAESSNVVTCEVRLVIGRSFDANGTATEEQSYNCMIHDDDALQVVSLPTSLSEELFVELDGADHGLLELVGVSLENGVLVFTDGYTWTLLDRRKRQLDVMGGTGNLTVLAVRVEAAGVIVPLTAATIAQKIFSSSTFSAQSVYSDCSHGQLELEPATGTGIKDGVYDLTVNADFSSMITTTEVESAVFGAMVSHFGASEQWPWDHIMFCVPEPAASAWNLWAYVNGKVSFFTGRWCSYPSGMVHELGHNFGLRHSHDQGAAYEDETCMMGYSYESNYYPRKCFNAHKHWLLGWYDWERLELTSDETWTGTLHSFTSPLTGEVDDLMLIKVEDLYMQFNRQESFNVDSGEYNNKVTVVQAPHDNANSNLLASLGSGSIWQHNFSNGDSISIHICSMTPHEVELSIYPTGQMSGCNAFVGLAPPGDTCLGRNEVCAGPEDCCSHRCFNSRCRGDLDSNRKRRSKASTGLGGGGGKRLRGRH